MNKVMISFFERPFKRLNNYDLQLPGMLSEKFYAPVTISGL
jgi:hypothetical protein